jgi:exoribonuclease II
VRREAAIAHGVPVLTTLSGARAAQAAIRAMQRGEWTVTSLQEHWKSR